MTFSLILYIYAGLLADGDSVALTHIDGFKSRNTCEAAAVETLKLTKASAKTTRWVCVAVE